MPSAAIVNFSSDKLAAAGKVKTPRYCPMMAEGRSWIFLSLIAAVAVLGLPEIITSSSRIWLSPMNFWLSLMSGLMLIVGWGGKGSWGAGGWGGVLAGRSAG